MGTYTPLDSQPVGCFSEIAIFRQQSFRDSQLHHGPHSSLRRRTQTGRKKNADILTLIEFLLEYDTAGDPISGGRRFPITLTPSLPTSSHMGGAKRACFAIPTPDNCSSSAIPAVVT